MSPKYVEIPKSSFQNVGVKVVTGHRFLGDMVVKKNIACNLSEKR